MTESPSRKLLKSYLDKKQLHDFKEYGHIWVITPTKHVYQIKDGASVIQWSAEGQRTSYHVWACDENGSFRDIYTSLLTQLLFLTSDYPRRLLDTACHGGAHWGDNRGAPPMKGWKADEKGRVPEPYAYP